MAGVLLADEAGHVRGEAGHRDVVQSSVRMSGQFHACYAQFTCGAGEFVRTYGVQVAGPAVQGGRLAVGEAEDCRGHAAVGQQGQEAAQAERLVVGMGDHHEHTPYSVRQTVSRACAGHLRCR
ncbi:hypothetical protein OG568_08680 [Streptomyces sp. NBC_01450]|nr:hypothetical protein [Streptomyces sp. NBC_01450]